MQKNFNLFSYSNEFHKYIPHFPEKNINEIQSNTKEIKMLISAHYHRNRYLPSIYISMICICDVFHLVPEVCVFSLNAKKMNDMICMRFFPLSLYEY